jgi:hypothetical protein
VELSAPVLWTVVEEAALATGQVSVRVSMPEVLRKYPWHVLTHAQDHRGTYECV